MKAGFVEGLEAFLNGLELGKLSLLHLLNEPVLKDSANFLHMAAGLGHVDLVAWLLHFGSIQTPAISGAILDRVD